jgi:hypothetical protein
VKSLAYIDRGERKPEDTGVSIIAKALAPQLGSAQGHLSEGQIDERKFAMLNEMTQPSLGYFKFRARVDKVRFWGHLVEWELVSSQALNGLGKRQVLQAIQAAAGTKSLEVAEKPNILARNLTQRDWKSKAIEQGKTPIE